MVKDGHDRSETVKDGQWSDWLTANEAEVYSLQVHQHKIKEKTWRRLTRKEPPPVEYREENIPHGTRYIFKRADIDIYVPDRKREAQNAMRRSEAVKTGQGRSETAEDGQDRSGTVTAGQQFREALTKKDNRIKELTNSLHSSEVRAAVNEKLANDYREDRDTAYHKLRETDRWLGVLQDRLLELRANASLPQLPSGEGESDAPSADAREPEQPPSEAAPPDDRERGTV